MTYKKLLRNSRPRHDSDGTRNEPVIQLPLIAKSGAMQAFVERCFHMAKMGHFILVLGHPGDLIEAPALFQHLMQRLSLERSITASPGNERQAARDADAEEVDALFIPCATQIPQGTQEFMSEGHLNHLRLVLLCYPMHKNMDVQSLIRPSLQRKCIGILQYPEWNQRIEDHVDCILAAVDIAEKNFNCKLDFNEDDFRGFCAKPWKSLAHILTAMMEMAKLKCQPEDSTNPIDIKM